MSIVLVSILVRRRAKGSCRVGIVQVEKRSVNESIEVVFNYYTMSRQVGLDMLLVMQFVVVVKLSGHLFQEHAKAESCL